MEAMLKPYCTRDIKNGLYCYKKKGHDGLHGWEYCQEQWGDWPTLDCDKKAGHDGPHHAEIEW